MLMVSVTGSRFKRTRNKTKFTFNGECLTLKQWSDFLRSLVYTWMTNEILNLFNLKKQKISGSSVLLPFNFLLNLTDSVIKRKKNAPCVCVLLSAPGPDLLVLLPFIFNFIYFSCTSCNIIPPENIKWWHSFMFWGKDFVVCQLS